MKDIAKREIRYAIHIPKRDYREDIHYVKELITFKNGETKSRVYTVADFERPVWVTKEAFRNHKEKKEFEDRDKLLEQKTTQSDINRTVAGLLGNPYLVNKPAEIKNSPYVYGYDITSTSLIKYTTLKKNNFIQSPYSVAAFDIETNPKTDEIILATIAFNGKTYTSILAKFVENIGDLNRRLQTALQVYLPQYKDLDMEVKVCSTEVELIEDVFRVANEWAPDFLAIWNMNFDIPKILSRLEKYKKNPVDIICDKDLPRKYRVCRYRKGISKKVTAAGKVKPVSPSLQWHTLISTTKFYVIDAMCVYRQLRMAKQEEPSYSLDAILKKELNTQKLKFEPADNYSGLEWHLFLQREYPVEYIIYNLYDCLSMLELDKETKDLSHSLPSFSSITDFSRFNSNPKKIVDALFLFGLERNLVIGTVPSLNKKAEEILDPDLDKALEETEAFDEDDVKNYKTLSLKGWIQTLPQNHLLRDGLKCIEEYPDMITNIRGITCDLDATSSYPSCTRISNVSKKNCVNEIIKIDGLSESKFREMNLSFCLGPANTLEYFSVMFNLPSLDKIDKCI